MARLDFLAEELDALERAGLARSLRRVATRQGPEIELDGRRVLNFASNDYLGLASDDRLTRAARAAVDRWGTGTGASRLIVGNQSLHEDLESEIARFHRAPAGLVFSTGYHANVGVLGALAGPGDLVVSDALNHASIIDGCRLSRARVAVYRHADADHAAELLAAPARRRFLVTESVFSMEGDRAPLPALAAAAEGAGAALVVDEAHAVGWAGPDGRGLAAAHGIVPDVLIGTFGKAFGSFGGYAVGSIDVRRWLISRARTFVFTTGLPAAVVEASRAAVALVAGEDGQGHRSSLTRTIQATAKRLQAANLAPTTTPILPIHVGDDRQVMAITAALLDRGLYVQGIRPPTVPRGTSRLRIGLTAAHTPEHLDHLLTALVELLPSTR